MGVGVEFATDTFGQRLLMLVDQYQWLAWIVVVLLIVVFLAVFGIAVNRVGWEWFRKKDVLPSLMSWLFRPMPLIGNRIAIYLQEQRTKSAKPIPRYQLIGLFVSMLGLTIVVFALAFIQESPNAYACVWQVQAVEHEGIVVEVGVREFPTSVVRIESDFDRTLELRGIWSGTPRQSPSILGISLDEAVGLEQLMVDGNELTIEFDYPNATLERSVYIYFEALDQIEKPISVVGGRIVTGYEKDNGVFKPVDRLGGCPDA